MGEYELPDFFLLLLYEVDYAFSEVLGYVLRIILGASLVCLHLLLNAAGFIFLAHQILRQLVKEGKIALVSTRLFKNVHAHFLSAPLSRDYRVVGGQRGREVVHESMDFILLGVCILKKVVVVGLGLLY